MFAFIPSLTQTALTLAFSGAALFTSLGFFNNSRKPEAQGLSSFQLGQLVIMGGGVFLAYKLLREVIE